MFHSNRLDEVVNALVDLQTQLRAKNWLLAGYSLGGNFALRIALRAPGAGLDLRQVVSICPVIDPAKALEAMEQGSWFYERYFERKWSRSLAIKRQCFPELYAHDDWSKLRSLRDRTHYLATQYAGFKDSTAYYDGYSIAGDRLLDLKIPSTLLTAADDPVVPVEDFMNLPDIAPLEVLISPHGGHCGFLKNWKLDSMAEDLILQHAQKELRKGLACPSAAWPDSASTAGAQLKPPGRVE